MLLCKHVHTEKFTVISLKSTSDNFNRELSVLIIAFVLVDNLSNQLLYSVSNL